MDECNGAGTDTTLYSLLEVTGSIVDISIAWLFRESFV